MDIQIHWRLFVTTIVIIVGLLTKTLVYTYLRKQQYANPEMKRRMMVSIRNLIFMLIVIAVSLIWLTQIRNLALSLAAIAVACVVATKELIMCFLGGMYRSMTQAFTVGDCIEISGVRGDVIDISLFSITLMEIGTKEQGHQYTGKSITIPNSALFEKFLINESYTEKYVLHIFTVPLMVTSSWEKAEDILLKAANNHCSEYISEAKTDMEKISYHSSFDTPNVSPRVTIHLPDSKRINLVVRIPVPARRKGKIEQAIIREFLKNFKSKVKTGENIIESIDE